jgi:hypothetical protein
LILSLDRAVTDEPLVREILKPVCRECGPGAIRQEAPESVSILCLNADARIEREAAVPALHEFASGFLRERVDLEQTAENGFPKSLRELGELLLRGRQSLMEAQSAVTESERPSRDHQVPVDVKVNRRSESLNERQESGS